MDDFRIAIGLPAAVPGTDMTMLGQYAAEAEEVGFSAVGVIDRLVYDNLDPLTALAAAAARTSRIELVTTVLNVGWRNNPALLAKQLSSVRQISGGRFTPGLGLGGWPEDYAASGVRQSGMAKVWTSTIEALDDFPDVLFGGMVPAAFRRVARHGSGWVAPLFGLATLREGAHAVRQAWREEGRSGQPRIVTGRYFGFGEVDEYLRHYYGEAYFALARADTLTSAEGLRAELAILKEAGVTDVVLYPTSPDRKQIVQLAKAVL